MSMTTEHETHEKYTQRITETLAFIDRNLDRAITLEDIAEAGNFSKFHFHRIFQLVVGDPVMHYVARRRLERAAHQLFSMRHKSVTEISHNCGFSSAANFSKLFKKYYNQTPSNVRKNGINIYKEEGGKPGQGKPFQPTQYFSDSTVQALAKIIAQFEHDFANVKILTLPDMTAVGYTLVKGYEQEYVFEARNKIHDWVTQHPHLVNSDEEFDIYHDSVRTTPHHKLRFTRIVVTRKTVKVPPPYTVVKVLGGKFAKLPCPIPIGECGQLVEDFITYWLPANNYAIRSYPMARFVEDDSSGDWYFPIDTI